MTFGSSSSRGTFSRFGFAGSLNRFRSLIIAQFSLKIKNQCKTFSVIYLFSAVCVIYSSRNCASRAIFGQFRSFPNIFSFLFSFRRAVSNITYKMGFRLAWFPGQAALFLRKIFVFRLSILLGLIKFATTSSFITKSLQLHSVLLPGPLLLYIS